MAKLSEQLKSKFTEARKISLEEHCEKHLYDPVKKANIAVLSALFRELKMKPRWYYSDKYKCHYKKEVVVYITVRNDNFIVTVTTSDAQWNVFVDGGVNAFLQTLNDEMKAEFSSHFKTCCGCSVNENNLCLSKDVEMDGVVHKNVCYKSLVYTVENPQGEQLKWIEKFIMARIGYIKNTAV